jgi:Kef-type K+ transport system membrane component KefB
MLKASKYRLVLVGLLIVVGVASIVGVSLALGSYISGLNIPLVEALTKVQSITQPQIINGGWVTGSCANKQLARLQ